MGQEELDPKKLFYREVWFMFTRCNLFNSPALGCIFVIIALEDMEQPN